MSLLVDLVLLTTVRVIGVLANFIFCYNYNTKKIQLPGAKNELILVLKYLKDNKNINYLKFSFPKGEM